MATQSVRPSYVTPPAEGWHVNFQDKSIDIASCYKGGRARYLTLQDEHNNPSIVQNATSGTMTAFDISPASLHFDHSSSTYQDSTGPLSTMSTIESSQTAPYYDLENSYPRPPEVGLYPAVTWDDFQPSDEHSPSLDDPEEVLFMQVYVEEVAVWMDSMDEERHFSHLLPYLALKHPMLKNALLACGSRHLVLVNPAYTAATAAKYYDAATQMLNRMLQNIDRDIALCAVTATVLNVYEIMYEKHTSFVRMNHIAGARALIKQCGWNGRSTGFGGACFWLNVGLDLFSCLFFNWRIGWDPDTWEVELNMDPNIQRKPDDWAHMMLCILAKITNFRVLPELHSHQDLDSREQVWTMHREACQRWNASIPPRVQPFMVVPSETQAKPGSRFPKIWILDQASIVAHLFYHTAMTLLGTLHPRASTDPSLANEMDSMSLHHASQICGIVAHCKDRYVAVRQSADRKSLTESRACASASIRCLVIAAEQLKIRPEQEEVLKIFESIETEIGWRLSFLNSMLKKKWGWLDAATGLGG